MSNYQICQRCVMDTSATEIVFFDDGRCSFCKDFDDRVSLEIHNDLPESFLVEFADQVKSSGSGREYDCLIGISGGVDSSYVCHLVKEMGLNVLVFVHWQFISTTGGIPSWLPQILKICVKNWISI